MKSPSPTEYNLLNALGAREVSGRDLAKLYEKETGRNISYGTLYTTMRRLKDDGWLTSREDDGEDRRVRYFRITGSGARALQHYEAMRDAMGGKEAIV